MSNEEILNILIDQIGLEKATEFCENVAIMYAIKFYACKTEDGCTEFDFERVWWNESFNKLNNQIQI